MTYTYGRPIFDADPSYQDEGALVYVPTTGKLWQLAWSENGSNDAPGLFAIIDAATLTLDGWTNDTTAADSPSAISAFSAFYSPADDTVWALILYPANSIVQFDSAGNELIVASGTAGSNIWVNTVSGACYTDKAQSTAGQEIRTVDPADGSVDTLIDLTDGTNKVAVLSVVNDSAGDLWFTTWTIDASNAFVKSEIHWWDGSTDTVVWSTTTYADRVSYAVYDSTRDTVLVQQQYTSGDGHVLPVDVATQTVGTAIAVPSAGVKAGWLRAKYDPVRDRIWLIAPTGGFGEDLSDPESLVLGLNPATLATIDSHDLFYDPTSADIANTPPNYWQASGTFTQAVVICESSPALYWSGYYYLWRDDPGEEEEFIFITKFVETVAGARRQQCFP